MTGNRATDGLETYAFETFPRGSLAFHLSRRKFWSALARELVVHARESEGKSAYKLADLGNWSDERLASVVPVMLDGCEITVRDSFVWGRPPGAGQPAQLFPLESPALAVYNRMNGQNRLDTNAHSLEVETGWDPGRSFAYVRGLFLWLVLAGVCRPKGAGD